ncbi:MAG: SpoIIE family protein phosphatase, partial [Acidobacteria bacterium]|nr:SpoIIE family protein phosphatase [Acidobacteriota bacterium]
VVAALLPSLMTEVKLHSNGKEGRVIVQLTPQGRLIRYCRERCGGDIQIDPDPGGRREREREKTEEKAATTAPTEAPPNQALAETTFNSFSGAEQALFAPAPQLTRDRQNAKFTWTATFATDDRLKLLAEISVRGAQVREVGFAPNFSEAFQHEADANKNPTQDVLKTLLGVLLLPFSIICLFLFFLGWGNGELLHRYALLNFAFCFLFMLLCSYFGGYLDDLNVDVPIKQAALAALVRFAVLALVMLLFAIPLYLFWASGHSLAARAQLRRTVAYELLIQGRLKSRYLWEQIAVGVLLGGALAALPFLLKTLPYLNALRFGIRDSYSQITAQSPVLSALTSDHLFSVFLFFSLIVPLLAAYLPRAWASLAVLLAGTVWFSGEAYFVASLPAALLFGVCLAAAYFTIYRRFDFLAVLVSALSSLAVLQARGLLAQPLPALKNSGWTVLAGLGVALVIALIGVWRGQELPQTAFEPLLKAANRAERERLKADLEVASRAQQQMLPGAPPQLPGYDIAAICTPSKDVGGDLYDFINLPDGRLGIVVADVSGKGVPAALYMTLTKGLLASVAEEQSDPGNILREVNRHLYEACRKKVFVTLFLGVLDPETRTLTYARAGHNPTVWRSPLRNATELLRPAGMGLGLNQGKIFNATLKVATLQLAADDALFFYSDGITEAMNAKQEEYGEERLMAVAAQTDKLNAGAALNAIMADVKAFLGSMAPQDDQTLVVVKVS